MRMLRFSRFFVKTVPAGRFGVNGNTTHIPLLNGMQPAYPAMRSSALHRSPMRASAPPPQPVEITTNTPNDVAPARSSAITRKSSCRCQPRSKGGGIQKVRSGGHGGGALHRFQDLLVVESQLAGLLHVAGRAGFAAVHVADRNVDQFDGRVL